MLERQDVANGFVRLCMDLDGLLERDAVYPTYWLRLWFTGPGGKGHRRGCTVVDPDPDDSVVESALAAASTAPAGTTCVVALEGAPTHRISAGLRKQVGLPKEQVHALTYWKRTEGRGPGRAVPNLANRTPMRSLSGRGRAIGTHRAARGAVPLR